MKRFKQLLALVISLQCALAGAQNVSGGCSFESQISPDEQAILENVKTALSPMSSNPACQAQVGQIKTFEQALSAYNQQATAISGAGISCMNYESVWNSRFDDFSNNWSAPGEADDSFATCRNKTSKDDAIQCAALITGRQKSTKRTACEAQKDTLTNTAGLELRTKTFQTGLSALNDVLTNPECVQSAGERRLGLVQSAVGLASQAATIAFLGTGVGLLVGAAAQLANAAIGNIFRNPSRQALAVLTNRDNFTKIACLYEKVEDKTLRCERITAGQQMDALKGLFDTSEKFCATNSDVLSQNELMLQIDSVIKKLNVPATPAANASVAPVLSAETFDGLVEQLNEKFAGKEESKLQIAEQSSREVKEKLDSVLSNDEALKQYLSETEEDKDISTAQLRRHHRELSTRRDQAATINKVLTAIREADAKGTQMTAEDRANVEKLLKEFNGGDKSFTGVFNDVMTTRATFGDDLGTRIGAYNARLDEARFHQQNLLLARNLERSNSAGFEDGGRFGEARVAVTPHLFRLLKTEMGTLLERVKKLTRVAPGTPSEALKETLRTQEESVIYPLLRACNQLRTVMVKTEGGSFNAGISGVPSICQAFHCEKGLNSFEDYLARRNISGLNVKSCDVNCKSQFDRFICQEKNSLITARAKIRNEFLTNGTICGKSIQDAFSKAKGL